MAANEGNNHVATCRFSVSSLPATLLNKGNNNTAAAKAMIAAKRVTITDSVRNCAIKYLRGEPKTFLTPTSRARFEERAVERFMKLTQAISNIKIAIAEKI